VRSEAVDTLVANTRPESLLAGVAAIALLTLLAGYLYVLEPSLTALGALEAGQPAASLESLQREFAANGVALTESERRLAALRDQLFGGPADLPPEKAEAYIVDRLDRTAASHAIELLGVRPGESKQVLMFDELLYEVEVEGEFFALVAWLREIERELRPLVINEFAMQPRTRSSRVAMKLRLASYRSRDGLS
jgi:Tfp pilus assembly protein PilO